MDEVYLDFQEAFDNIPQRGLEGKVRTCGMAGRVDNSIENWLSDRKQKSGCEWERMSGWEDVRSGISTSGISSRTITIHNFHQ